MDMPTWTDNTYLLEEFRRGNVAAFKHIYAVNQHTLFILARKILDSDDAAQDVVTEAFVKLWNRRQTPMPIESIRAWLIKVVRNSCFDELKRRKRSEGVLSNWIALERSDVQEAEFAGTFDIYASLLEKVSDYMAKMPRAMRQIFQMSYIDNMSVAEIAKKLAISEDTVRVQKARGINSIKKSLRPEELIILMMLVNSVGGFIIERNNLL